MEALRYSLRAVLHASATRGTLAMLAFVLNAQWIRTKMHPVRRHAERAHLILRLERWSAALTSVTVCVTLGLLPSRPQTSVKNVP